MGHDGEPLTTAYRTVIGIGGLFMRLSRATVTGTEHIPASGPVLILANHDSNWDPVAIGWAGRHRRQIRALAKASLWKNPVVGRILDGMGQIPIQRGAADLDALAAARQLLNDGGCLGVFPEGTRSLGRPLRARSGAGFLVKDVPATTIVCARVRGTTDRLWLPGDAHVRVDFFLPTGGQLQPGETAIGVVKRVLAEIRAGAPPVVRRRRSESPDAASGAADRP